MSDVGTPAPAPAATPAAPVGGAPPAPEGEPDYRELFEQQKSTAIKERNLYQPAMRLLNDLDDDSRAALMDLADMVRAGDNEAITDWAAGTIENMARAKGTDAAAVIAARQAAQHPTATPTGQVQASPLGQPAVPAPVALTADDARRIAREEAASQQRTSELVAQVRGEISAAGYNPDDAIGQTIIRHARLERATIADSIKWYSDEVTRITSARQQALTDAAAQVPAPPPNGAPPGTPALEGATPRERAEARARGWSGA